MPHMYITYPSMRKIKTLFPLQIFSLLSFFMGFY